MNFVRYGEELINLDLVRNIKFIKEDNASNDNAIAFLYEKGQETVIYFSGPAFDKERLNLLSKVGVIE